MCHAFHERYVFSLDFLQSIPGFETLPTDGSFYLFPSIEKLLNGRDDIAFAESLLKEAGVAVVPGSAFGAPGHIRLSIAHHKDELKKAFERIKKAVG